MTSGASSTSGGARDTSLRSLAVALLAGGLVGKVAGIARELALAAAYGTSLVTSAFRVAQTGTLIPVNLFTSDALNSAFLPLYGQASRRDAVSAMKLYRCTQLLLVSVTTCVAVAVFVLSHRVVDVLAPGLSFHAKEIASGMIRIMSVGMPFYVAGATISFLSIANGLPRLVSLRSTIQNLFLLGGVGLAVLSSRLEFLPAGFTVGCVVFYIFGVTQVRSSRLVVQGQGWPVSWAEFREVVSPLALLVRRLALVPILIQCNEAAERVFASTLGEQAVAATEFANFIVDTVVVLLSVPIGLAAVASMSQAKDLLGAARERMKNMLELLLVVGVGMSLVLSTGAPVLVSLVYERGSFDAESTRLTATILLGFSVGLWLTLVGGVASKILSGTMQTRSFVFAQGLGVVVGVSVMSLALPTQNPMFLGLGGSAYGLVVTVISLACLRLIPNCLHRCAVLAPGVVFSLALAYVNWYVELIPSVMTGLAVALAWLIYCAFLPSVRKQVVGVVRSRV